MRGPEETRIIATLSPEEFSGLQSSLSCWAQCLLFPRCFQIPQHPSFMLQEFQKFCDGEQPWLHGTLRGNYASGNSEGENNLFS